MIPKCLNACIIASSFSGVHCGCLAFSDLARLKFSPTSSLHFFLICAIYSDETLSPVCSSTYAFIYSYVAFPLNSDKSISSREKSTFTFLLSTILRSTSVRAEQRSTGPLAPLQCSKSNTYCKCVNACCNGCRDHYCRSDWCWVRFWIFFQSLSQHIQSNQYKKDKR